MIDEQLGDKIKELSEEYGLSTDVIKKYYTTLMTYPCVSEGDDAYLYDCLEILVSERSSQQFMKKETESRSLINPLFASVEECVYRIYQDDAVPYLSEEFKERHDIKERSI